MEIARRIELKLSDIVVGCPILKNVSVDSSLKQSNNSIGVFNCEVTTKDGESHEVMIYWYVNGTKFIPKDKTKPYIFQTHADSLEINPFVADLEKVISDVFPNAEFKLTGYKLISNEKYAGLPTPLASLIDLQ